MEKQNKLSAYFQNLQPVLNVHVSLTIKEPIPNQEFIPNQESKTDEDLANDTIEPNLCISTCVESNLLTSNFKSILFKNKKFCSKFFIIFYKKLHI